MKKLQYLCPNCMRITELSTKPKRSFMGFQKIHCSNCKSEFRYPLTTGYVIFYWIYLLGNIALAIYFLFLTNSMFILNPIGLIILIYVVKNLKTNRILKEDIHNIQMSVEEYGGPQEEDNIIETYNCPHCGTQRVLLMSDGECPNCKKVIHGISE